MGSLLELAGTLPEWQGIGLIFLCAKEDTRKPRLWTVTWVRPGWWRWPSRSCGAGAEASRGGLPSCGPPCSAILVTQPLFHACLAWILGKTGSCRIRPILCHLSVNYFSDYSARVHLWSWFRCFPKTSEFCITATKMSAWSNWMQGVYG